MLVLRAIIASLNIKFNVRKNINCLPKGVPTVGLPDGKRHNVKRPLETSVMTRKMLPI